jgi:predicted Zn-ribbon and HTH transcriptional regulator
MPDFIKIKKWKRKILYHYAKICELEEAIKQAEYDEPVRCLNCGWEGVESELDPDCDDFSFPIIKSEGCPKCKSLGWEYRRLPEIDKE